jgi:hypothetical protein
VDETASYRMRGDHSGPLQTPAMHLTVVMGGAHRYTVLLLLAMSAVICVRSPLHVAFDLMSQMTKMEPDDDGVAVLGVVLGVVLDGVLDVVLGELLAGLGERAADAFAAGMQRRSLLAWQQGGPHPVPF